MENNWSVDPLGNIEDRRIITSLRLDMTIVADRDVKPQIKERDKINTELNYLRKVICLRKFLSLTFRN